MKKLLTIVFIVVCFYAKATDTSKIIIYFDFNKYELTLPAKQTLDSLISSIDTANIFIDYLKLVGHTDQVGSTDYNVKLSLQRANEVLEYLKPHSLIIGNINKIDGFGKSYLLTHSLSENEKYINRRVELFYIIKQKEKKKIVVEKEVEKPIIKEDIKEKPRPKKVKEIIKDTATKVGSNIELPYILFVGGRHDFLVISYPYLDELFYALRDNPTIEIEIQGHICCSPGIGDAHDYGTGNDDLSVARAKAVYDFLIEKGIDKKRLSYKGFAHKFPLTLERNAEEQQRNRRVEIKILKK